MSSLYLYRVYESPLLLFYGPFDRWIDEEPEAHLLVYVFQVLVKVTW